MSFLYFSHPEDALRLCANHLIDHIDLELFIHSSRDAACRRHFISAERIMMRALVWILLFMLYFVNTIAQNNCDPAARLFKPQ